MSLQSIGCTIARRYETDKMYIFTYVWSLNGFGERSCVEILFIEIGCNNKTACIPFKFDFMPFRHDDFIVRLQDCGLKIVKDSFRLENDNYSIILEK